MGVFVVGESKWQPSWQGEWRDAARTVSLAGMQVEVNHRGQDG
jgi:hypothetical protein